MKHEIDGITYSGEYKYKCKKCKARLRKEDINKSCDVEEN